MNEVETILLHCCDRQKPLQFETQDIQYSNMPGVSTRVESSRMKELTRGQRSGFGGLLHANWYLLLTAGTACIGSSLYGTDQGVLSNLLTGKNFGAKFSDVYTNPVLKGWVVAVLQLGAWLGALINGPLGKKISRKYTITVAAFVSLIPWKEIK